MQWMHRVRRVPSGTAPAGNAQGTATVGGNRRRVLIASGVLGVLACAIVSVGIWRQTSEDRLPHNASHVREARGRILDRNGTVLAHDGIRWSLFADPTLVQNPRFIAQQLAPVLSRDPGQIEAGLARDSSFAWLKRGLTTEQHDQLARLQRTIYVAEPGKVTEGAGDDRNRDARVRDAVDCLHAILGKAGVRISEQEIRARLMPDSRPGALGGALQDGPSSSVARRLAERPIPGVIYGLPGVFFRSEPRRRYPFGRLASASLGFVRYENGLAIGVSGLERTQDGRLGRLMPRSTGRRDVVLTIDLPIQQAAERELARAVESAHAKAGQCVVLDPRSGEVLALATFPSWDANAPGQDSAIPFTNPAVGGMIEPGTGFCIVPAMAALESGLVKHGQVINTCSGTLPVGRRVIRESSHGHGQVDLNRFLTRSCISTGAGLALRLGPERFLKYCEALGFGSRTGIELTCELSGQLNSDRMRTPISLANMGFGQGLAVTPMQLAAAYSAIADGGEWVQPHLVMGQASSVGHKRVCSTKTAILLGHYLEDSVRQGTGRSAAIPGYRVAGKVGVAQKAIPGNGYRSGQVVVSCAGFLPADAPQITVLAIIDDPKTPVSGGTVAASLFREVGRAAMERLQVTRGAHAD